MPMINEFVQQSRPELRTPTVDEYGDNICPRCNVKLDEFEGIGFVSIPVDAFDLEHSAELCKRYNIDLVRGRGWVCPNHTRELHVLRTCSTMRASGWKRYCGMRIRLDDGSTTIVPILLEDLPRDLARYIELVLGRDGR